MKEVDIARAKELRGDIIERLYTMYGEAVTLGTLRNLLRYKSYFSEDDIKKAVKYLSGDKKEYITVKPDDGNYWDSFVALTPAGINLAEHDISDMGVMIDG